MTTNSLTADASIPFAGLGTVTYNAAATGIYTVGVQCTIPLASSLQILIKQNASTILTLSAPTPTQQSLSGSTHFQCTAADVITVVLSSSAAVDSLPNAVKSVINIFAGE